MPSVIIYVNHDMYDELDINMFHQALEAVRQRLPAENDHAGVPFESDVIRRHEWGECVSNFLIVIHAGNDPVREELKKQIIRDITHSIANAWGRSDVAVRLRLENAAFYVYAPEFPL